MNDTPPTNPQPDADKARRWRVAIILVAISVVLLAARFIAMTTAGFGPYEEMAQAARPPTLWEWLDLLIVPLAVAAGAAIISYVQKRTELDIAQQARASEQQIAGDRLRQASLEGYYDRMTELLLTHKLREAKEEAEERSLARARTVAVARGLDGERKGQLLAFLKTSGLIAKDNPVIDLQGVDFSGASLPRADLGGANLSGANLSGANLSDANLSDANLSDAKLSDANLSDAKLSDANLHGANLSGANLSGADLSGANLSGADLSGASLSRAKLREANLSDAMLRGANMSDAGLSRADLRGADLSGANLSKAYLIGVDLRGANLIRAIGWTIRQLEQARVIARSVLPDGTRLADEVTIVGQAPTFAEWKAQQKDEG